MGFHFSKAFLVSLSFLPVKNALQNGPALINLLHDVLFARNAPMDRSAVTVEIKMRAVASRLLINVQSSAHACNLVPICHYRLQYSISCMSLERLTFM